MNINNSNIVFDVAITGEQWYDTSYTGSRFIIITEHEDSFHLQRVRLSYDDWMALLRDESTDWAVNLLLYEQYHKDALFFMNRRKRENWMSMREEDIAYWQKFLKEKLKK